MAKYSVDKTLLRAEAHMRKGEHDDARAMYEAVLVRFPKNARAQQGLARLNNLKSSASITGAPPKEKIDALIAVYNTGQYQTLVDQTEAAVAEHPSSFVLWNIRAAGLRALGRLAEAESSFRKTAELNPTYADAYNNLGVTLQEQGKYIEALAAYQRALKINPEHTEGYYNKGNTLKALGKLDEAIAHYQRAIKIKPAYADAYNNLGVTLHEQGKFHEAISTYKLAIKVNPTHAEAFYNIGNALKEQGQLVKAIAAYRRTLEINPAHVEAYNNMGNVLKEEGRLDEAITSYRCAIEIKPAHAEVHYNIGNALKEQGKLDEAIDAYRRATQIKPDHAEAYYNIGNALKERGKLDEAISAHRRALEIKPAFANAEVQLLHQKQQICDFSVTEELIKASAFLGIKTDAVAPFAALGWDDNPRQHLTRAVNWAKAKFKHLPLPLPARPKHQPKRLKIGYLSADFHDHATMYLMAGLLREHDRSSFETFAYSYGRRKSGIWREQAKNNVDHFFDVSDEPDRLIVDIVRTHALDFAVDLKGYTQNSRVELFQHRLAPIQINYLGFPGTMGAEFYDYIVADRTVIPENQRKFYSENVIYLPHTYQPNDKNRPIAATSSSRSDLELPEDAFVFCCFNNNYKISSAEFNIWMRLLDAVKGSALWLLRSNKWAEVNLRREAAARGIDPSRLVFAPKLPHAEHLARHQHADLFIDTFNYNAHTTASDALWSGLPVVTKQGEQFAARVAASLLTAIGLPELITKTEEEYERLILDLATHPTQLKVIKARLAENRLSAPLFDTIRYTRNFERGLKRTFNLYLEGTKPRDVEITEDDS